MTKDWKLEMFPDKSNEVLKSKPAKFIESKSKYCNEYDVPETYGRDKGNYDRTSIPSKINYDLIIKTIQSNLGLRTQEFLVNDLLQIIDVNECSNGSRQREILFYLVCRGIIKHSLSYHENGRRFSLFSYVEECDRIQCKFFQNLTKKREGMFFRCVNDWSDPEDGGNTYKLNPLETRKQ